MAPSQSPRIRGVGLGFRFALLDELGELDPADAPELAWLECHPENYMRRGGRYPAALASAREKWPFVTHGLAMSLGAQAPTDPGYLETLAGFLRDIGTPWHSDHLCLSSSDEAALHELLPLPFSEQAAAHVAAKLREAQKALPVPLLIENVTYYAHAPGGDMSEGGFVRAVCEQADCGLLLDVNNVFVNARNHDLDPRELLESMPLDRVTQIHVAGHDQEDDGLLLDTHARPVRDEVFALLEVALARTGRVPILLERDDDFPSLADLLAEVRALDALYRAAPVAPSR